jgi:3-oxoacyl-[acyl-carrier protein] reductase
MKLGLEGKVALVTGGSKGIGRATAEAFAEEGAHVSICARGAQSLAAAAEGLRRFGVTVVATTADVNRAEDVERVVEATLEVTGRIDVLVNNAGDIAVGRTVATSDDEWRATLETNVLGAVRFTRAVVPHMRRAGGGRIVNVGSVFGHTVPMAGSVDYNASKAALISFSRTMAVELAADGILVNTVCPGWVETPMLERILDEARPVLAAADPRQVWQAFESLLLIKRMGRVDEVASLIAYLASARAAYVTGSVYDIDGGFPKSC